MKAKLLIVVLLFGAGLTQTGRATQRCSIDHVVNGWGLDSILTGQYVEFVIRVTNTPGDGCYYQGSFNWQIYSPDGASWSMDTAKGLFYIPDGLDTLNFSDIFTEISPSIGPPADTVLFAGLTSVSETSGFFDGFDENLFVIKLKPDPASAGLHICIDTVGRNVTAGYEWAWFGFCGCPDTVLDWSAPWGGYCFEIVNHEFEGHDLAVSLATDRARQGKRFRYGLTYQNKGAVSVENATITLVLPEDVDFVAASPGGNYLPAAHSVTWNRTSLYSGLFDWLWVDADVPSTVAVGTQLAAMATIEPIGNDIAPYDNIRSIQHEVFGLLVPNEKAVDPAGAGPGGEIQRTDTLHYQVYFQNVGNDTALTVVIRDSLDSDLDSTSLHIGASSHPYQFQRVGAEMAWIFENIRLPDSLIDEPGSRGFVSYDVLPAPDAEYGTEIENKAVVYFDYYPGVITNTVLNTISGCCGLYTANHTGNTDCDDLGKRNLADITKLIDRVYLSKQPLCCEENGNVDGDSEAKLNLADITKLIDHVYLSKVETAACP